MPISSSQVPVDAKGRETKKHGTDQFPIAAYRSTLHYPVPWHWHEDLEAGLVRRGTVRLSAGTEEYLVEAGQGFLLNADLIHSIHRSTRESCELISLVFSPRIIAGSMESVFWQKYMAPVLSGKAPRVLILNEDSPWHSQIRQDIETAWNALEQEPAGYEFKVRTALSDSVFTLSQHLPDISSGPDRRAIREEERIMAMLAFIEDHFSEEITLKQIADAASVSESECLRCFRHVLHTSPVRYLKLLRIRKAAALLKNPGMKISDAAAMCGFLDMSYFAGTFREVYGMSPKEYRRLPVPEESGHQ